MVKGLLHAGSYSHCLVQAYALIIPRQCARLQEGLASLGPTQCNQNHPNPHDPTQAKVKSWLGLFGFELG